MLPTIFLVTFQVIAEILTQLKPNKHICRVGGAWSCQFTNITKFIVHRKPFNWGDLWNLDDLFESTIVFFKVICNAFWLGCIELLNCIPAPSFKLCKYSSEGKYFVENMPWIDYTFHEVTFNTTRFNTLTLFQSKPCIGVKVGHFPLYSSCANATTTHNKTPKNLIIFVQVL